MTTNRPTGRDRRKEERVPANFPLSYFFMHQVEDVSTKTFRSGVTHDVSRFGVSFEAIVVDPSIIPMAMRGEILIYTRVTMPDGDHIVPARARLVWSVPREGESSNTHLVGIEYVDVDEADRIALFKAACHEAGFAEPA